MCHEVAFVTEHLRLFYVYEISREKELYARLLLVHARVTIPPFSGVQIEAWFCLRAAPLEGRPRGVFTTGLKVDARPDSKRLG